jgi:STAM-binding protein
MALAGAASNGFGQAPMNVAGIVREAGSFEYDPEIPLRYWFRTADAIQKQVCLQTWKSLRLIITMLQAQSYERDGHDQDAYLFYMRHAMLASEKLPRHPDYKLAEHAVARKRLQRNLLRDLDIMEALQPKINERYARYTAAIAQRKAEREKWQWEHAQSLSQPALVRDMDRMSLQGRQDTRQRTERLELDAAKDENRALALSLANKELRRRRSKRRDPTQERGHNQNQQAPSDDVEGEDLSQKIMAAARRREQAHLERNGHAPDHDRTSQAHQAYNYPSIPHKTVYTLEQEPPTRYDSIQRSAAPQRPPKEHIIKQAPQRPPKESFSSIIPANPRTPAPAPAPDPHPHYAPGSGPGPAPKGNTR